jgi:glycosyltransferase involved in cell wall biosynthesis
MNSQASIPISFVVFAYNEANRIRNVLEHAVRWADEVVVINKSSTDSTKAICQEYGAQVRVIDMPFSPQGHDDVIAITQLPTHDWIYFGSASEIPTRKLIERIRQVLTATHGELDLIYVPRKYYSFGIHDPRSPWSIVYFPFLINRRKAIVTNTVHNNFHPRDPSNTARIEFAEDCCVYHLTHTSAESYLRAMTDYFGAEAAACEDPEGKIRACLTQIARYGPQLRQGGDELLGHYFAWSIYWLGTALFVWEKWRGVDVRSFYQELADAVLQQEWLGSTDNGPTEQKPTPSGDSVVVPQLSSPLASSERLGDFLRHGIEGIERKLREEEQLAAGFLAYQQGDLAAMRRHFLQAILRNPFVLRNLGIISLLLESMVGAGAMARYRAWRHRSPRPAADAKM